MSVRKIVIPIGMATATKLRCMPRKQKAQLPGEQGQRSHEWAQVWMLPKRDDSAGPRGRPRAPHPQTQTVPRPYSGRQAPHPQTQTVPRPYSGRLGPRLVAVGGAGSAGMRGLSGLGGLRGLSAPLRAQ